MAAAIHRATAKPFTRDTCGMGVTGQEEGKGNLRRCNEDDDGGSVDDDAEESILGRGIGTARDRV